MTKLFNPFKFLRKVFWRMIRYRIAAYAHANEHVRECYLRHTAAFEYPNPLLSDFDVTFFVECMSVQQFREISCAINRDLQNSWLRYWVPHAIVLPATKSAYLACSQSYPLRSSYPFKSWRLIAQTDLGERALSASTLPLDHTPESFLNSYIIPVIRGDLSKRPLQFAFLWRKAGQLRNKHAQQRRTFKSLTIAGALQREITHWDRFFAETAELFCPNQNDASVLFPDFPILTRASEVLAVLSVEFYQQHKIQSVWIYPYSLDDSSVTVCVNVTPDAPAAAIRDALRKVHRLLDSIPHLLLAGTETSMVGRINMLSRLTLFEPWLFKHAARCLFGDFTIRTRIIEPTKEQLTAKYREFLLYFNYSRMIRSNFPYAMYRAAFTMDFFCHHNQLIFDEQVLNEKYAGRFVMQTDFDVRRDLVKLLAFHELEQHFSIFDSLQ